MMSQESLEKLRKLVERALEDAGFKVGVRVQCQEMMVYSEKGRRRTLHRTLQRKDGCANNLLFCHFKLLRSRAVR